MTVAEALDDPHNRARGMAVEVALPGGGTALQIGCPVRLEGQRPASDAASPPGADTHDILSGLGLTDDQINALKGTIA